MTPPKIEDGTPNKWSLNDHFANWICLCLGDFGFQVLSHCASPDLGKNNFLWPLAGAVL